MHLGTKFNDDADDYDDGGGDIDDGDSDDDGDFELRKRRKG